MSKQHFVATIVVSVLAFASAPAFAGNYIGYDVDYVLNLNGREAPQSYAPGAYAFGVDVWYVPGSAARHIDPQARGTIVIEQWKDEAFTAEAPRHAFGLRALGHQADA